MVKFYAICVTYFSNYVCNFAKTTKQGFRHEEIDIISNARGYFVHSMHKQ